MRILFVTPGLPYPPDSGGRSRTFNLLQGLGRRHEVHLLSLLHQDEDPAGVGHLEEFCASVVTVDTTSDGRNGLLPKLRRFSPWPPRTLSPCHSLSLVKVIREFTTQRFAVVHLDNLGLARYVQLFDSMPVILSKQDLEWVVLQRVASVSDLSSWRRLRTRWAIERLRCYEKGVCRQFAAVITVSEDDRRLLAGEFSPDRIAVVPNGVDTEYFRPWPPSSSDSAELLFVGSLFWVPNVDAVTYFCDGILPLIKQHCPEVRVSIVGGGAPASMDRLAAIPGVSLVGRVEDVRPYYARARACIVPLRSAGGTRLRILEAMAMSKPVVSTSIGAEGLQVQDGEHLLIANSAEEFARRVVTLLREPDLGMVLGQRARIRVQEAYQWSSIVSKLEEVYTTVQERRR